jgi:hypothetical protein
MFTLAATVLLQVVTCFGQTDIAAIGNGTSGWGSGDIAAIGNGTSGWGSGDIA